MGIHPIHLDTEQISPFLRPVLYPALLHSCACVAPSFWELISFASKYRHPSRTFHLFPASSRSLLPFLPPPAGPWLLSSLVVKNIAGPLRPSANFSPQSSRHLENRASRLLPIPVRLTLQDGSAEQHQPLREARLAQRRLSDHIQSPDDSLMAAVVYRVGILHVRERELEWTLPPPNNLGCKLP